MNNKFKKITKSFTGKNGVRNLVISIVILVEIIALLAVATFAWVETVSSIKITTKDNDPLEVDTYYLTEAMIGGTGGTVDLGRYFKPSGDMHYAPCSSADGDSFYFPKKNGSTAFISSGNNRFRKGNSSDKNTAYMSVTFKLKADTNADFFFYFNGNDNPTFSSQAANMRVSVTAYTEGTSKGDLYDSTGKPLYTKVYANTASTSAVVSNTNGGTTATAIEAFSAHKKGSGTSNRLFAVGASETKIVTINVWLQGTSSSSSLASDIAISNFGITSSLTPRHVTLLPTNEWDVSNVTEYYYAWCWGATNGDASRLYQLDIDADGHYSFDYNGTYQNTLFFRSGTNGLTTANMNANNNAAWSNGTIWNKTEDTSIPNDPVDPTYIIETINGSTQTDTSSGSSSTAKKSTGSWHDPATISVAYATGMDSNWGTMTVTSYVGTATNSHVIETSSSLYTNHAAGTVHAWPGKIIKLVATPKTNYAFVGWYTDAACTTQAPTVNGTAYTAATYTPNAPSTASEITYYAKFKKTRTLTIVKYLDGSQTTSTTATDVGYFTIGTGSGNTSSDDVTQFSRTFDFGSQVSFSGTASSGYSLTGIYTTSGGTTTASSPVTLDGNNNVTYYARFTTNSYSVTTRPYYCSTYGGTSYSQGNTGGTVKTGTAAATSGSTYTSSQNVTYKTKVNLVASPASGYGFVGWYDAASGGNLLSPNTTYEYTLSSPSAQTVYGRFAKMGTTSIYVTPRADWGDNYYVRLYDSGGNNISGNTNGFVQATYDTATGYYKATFSTIKTGKFYAELAKDNNYTDMVPSSGGYEGNLGTNYRFKKDTEGITTFSGTERCIWFIDGTSSKWIVSDCNLGTNNGGTLIRSYYSSLTTMTKINNDCWIYEYSSLTNGNYIYFNQNYKNNDTYEKNHWKAQLQSGKNQYTATGGAGHDNYGSGSWTN